MNYKEWNGYEYVSSTSDHARLTGTTPTLVFRYTEGGMVIDWVELPRKNGKTRLSAAHAGYAIGGEALRDEICRAFAIPQDTDV